MSRKEKLKQWARSNEQFPGWYNERDGGGTDGSDLLFFLIVMVAISLGIGFIGWRLL